MTKHLWIWLLLGCCIGSLQAQQDEIPPRSYRPDELVSFNPNTPFNTVIDILNSFAQRFDNRIIIDTKVRTRPIGVSVENMYWKRAFEYVLRSNMLKYTARDRYYAIEDLIPQKEEPEAKAPFTINTSEVEINAVFFQADYQTMREAGIDWSTFKNGTVQIQSFGATNVTNNFFRASYNATVRRVNVNALLRAFESMSKGEVLARPQIRVMSGQKGKIKVGTNFYLTTVDFAGNLRFSEYEAGIIMTVTPTVVGRNDSTFIHLNINAERSDVTLASTNTSKNITEGSTQVLLLDGEETAMAGLISTSHQTVRRGIPFLKDLPPWFFGLRYVFGYESVLHNKRELVILLGARLVNPLPERRNARIDMQDYLEGQKRELKRLQRGGSSTPSTSGGARRARSTSQKSR